MKNQEMWALILTKLLKNNILSKSNSIHKIFKYKKPKNVNNNKLKNNYKKLTK